ncbi:MAG: hypothetical protein A4E37_01185 [Methanoregulaceae archaeon PtaB.Bin056]|nr:MAG: hypothetical protein A4E37_01185 [Methanoregulaceae archaeon PtaB.Bin056]
MVKAVDLQVRSAGRLADMMVHDQHLVFAESPLHEEVLLACPKVAEYLERVILRHLAHGHGLKLPDMHGSRADSRPGEGFCKDGLAGDTIGIDMGDDGHLFVGEYLPCRCPGIIAETHCDSNGVSRRKRVGMGHVAGRMESLHLAPGGMFHISRGRYPGRIRLQGRGS